MPEAFLVLSVVAALFTVNAYRPLPRTGPLSVFSFFAGWLTSELPAHHIAWQVLGTAVFAALGAFEAWQGWLGLGITLVSWGALAYLVVEANRAADVVEAALCETLGPDYRTRVLPELADRVSPPVSKRQLVWPFRFRHPEVVRTKNLEYSPHGRRGLLDVYRHRDEPRNSPVLLQVHGGGWVIGNKDQQGLPLMTHLASLGWVCVAINYRLSPRATFPDHLVDVKQAIDWVKKHIAEYGGNPDFIVITGGSAGGHLCSLAALTPNDPAFQPGFEASDTAVQACVPFYGVYDFTNRERLGRKDMRRFLERSVMKKRFDRDPEAFEQASPMSHVGDHAPPFFVIHGKNDTLVPVAQCRLFVRLLRAASRAPVLYVELPGAQHAFEVFTSVRSGHVVRGVERFVGVVYSDWLRRHGEVGTVDDVDDRSSATPAERLA